MSRTLTYMSSCRDTVRRRAAGKCEWCGKPFERRMGGLTDCTLHHRFKKEWGGKDSVTNLMAVHDACHKGFHRDEDHAAKLGLILWDDESTWRPVTVKVGDLPLEWVLLTGEGDYDEVEPILLRDLANSARPAKRQRRAA